MFPNNFRSLAHKMKKIDFCDFKISKKTEPGNLQTLSLYLKVFTKITKSQKLNKVFLFYKHWLVYLKLLY